jgi:hypothetical protein
MVTGYGAACPPASARWIAACGSSMPAPVRAETGADVVPDAVDSGHLVHRVRRGGVHDVWIRSASATSCSVEWNASTSRCGSP